MNKPILVNRAPVLSLWAAVVAERLGYAWADALSLGKAVAGHTVNNSGSRAGLATEEPETAPEKSRAVDEEYLISLCGRDVTARFTANGVRGVSKAEEVDSDRAELNLRNAFGDNYDAVTAAMRKLAGSRARTVINQEAYSLFERFRPAIDSGVKGWSQKGRLEIQLIEGLAYIS